MRTMCRHSRAVKLISLWLNIEECIHVNISRNICIDMYDLLAANFPHRVALDGELYTPHLHRTVGYNYLREHN